MNNKVHFKPILKVFAGIMALLMFASVVAACEDPDHTVAKFNDNFATNNFSSLYDFGFSGQNLLTFPPNNQIANWHGDHNSMCEAPTTLRDVAPAGSTSHLDFSQMFWYCAPGGNPANGHIMTGVNTTGYNIAWFSPKPTFHKVTGVCWDLNETTMSRRKWTQVLFVDSADATRYPNSADENVVDHMPDGTPVPHRGTGGFDLGIPSPEFSPPVAASTNIISGGYDGHNMTVRGFKESYATDFGTPGLMAQWFQPHPEAVTSSNTTGDDFTTPGWGATDSGGLSRVAPNNTDKATRYQHCLHNENVAISSEFPEGQAVVFEEDVPASSRYPADSSGKGHRTLVMRGHIPDGDVRVVFEDDNYNPPKDSPPENPDGTYNADTLTWHWDNIQVYTIENPNAGNIFSGDDKTPWQN